MFLKIHKDGKLITEFKRTGRENLAVFEDGSSMKAGELNQVECECHVCLEFKTIRYRAALLKKPYTCQSCNNSGQNNPFYGKKHTEENKQLHSEKMKGRFVGENNPFYGKKHTEEYKAEAAVRSKKYEESLTEEQRIARSERFSKIQEMKKLSDPLYYEKKAMGGRAAACSSVRYKMNKLEEAVLTKATELGIKFEYSIILGFMQFDFGISDFRILLEVNGDYWHANPNLYGDDVGLKPLNNTQLRKIDADAKKRQFASDNDLKLFVIWEEQVRKNDWSVLEEIKNEIRID